MVQARNALSWFEQKTRSHGKTKYWACKNGSPDVMRKLCSKAHDDGDGDTMLPDDWKYKFLVDALERISEWHDMDDADPWEPPVYHHELSEWLGSHAYRPSYVDDAIKDYGPDHEQGIMALIGWGMIYEFRMVQDAALEFLAGDDPVDVIPPAPLPSTVKAEGKAT